MKMIIPEFTRKASIFFLTLFIAVFSFAQDADKKIDISIDTKDNSAGFFSQPWVWIVGVAVFILLLVALLRGGNGNKSNA